MVVEEKVMVVKEEEEKVMVVEAGSMVALEVALTNVPL